MATSASPGFECLVTGCKVKIPEASSDIQKMLLETHNSDAHGDLTQSRQTVGESSGAKAQKLQRPVIPEDCTENQWSFFLDKWCDFKRFYGLREGPEIYSHLRSCCSDDLQYKLYSATGGNAKNLSEANLVKELRRLAVVKVNVAVNIKDFLELKQDAGEPVRQFQARLQGKALSCEFNLKTEHKCTCGKVTEVTVAYMEEMIRHKVVTGLVDPDILQDVLASDLKSLEETVVFVEGKESGKKGQQSLAGANVNKIHSQSSDGKQKCKFCGKEGHGSSPSDEVRRESCKAWGVECFRCGKKGHFKFLCKGKPKKKTEEKKGDVKEVDAELGSFQPAAFCCNVDARLSHWMHDKIKGWRVQQPTGHPTLKVSVSLAVDGYQAAGLSVPKRWSDSQVVEHRALADTGAQITCCGMAMIRDLGLSRKDLIGVRMSLNTASSTSMEVLGAVFLKIRAKSSSGKWVDSRQLCYVARGLKVLYLSKEACVDLQCISESFPIAGNASEVAMVDADSRVLVEPLAEDEELMDWEKGPCKPDEKGQCRCPRRGSTPRPPGAPCELIPENREKLERFLKEYYAGSVFNQCGTQRLPEITGPPLKIFVKKNAQPIAVHKPVPVAVHWREEVRKELERDCKLGVLDKVDVNNPADWCHKMVVVPKKTGKPRRTVDLQPLNRVTVRQTHHTQSPWHLARSVPANTKKTTCDVWNSFHTVPIRKEDRKFTQFITPWGRYQYGRAPQGASWSGDAFTQRYDEVTKDVKQIAKIIDDALLWDCDVAQAFHRVAEYLTLCGDNGIVLNPDKFRFAEDEVEFAGFNITKDSVRPSEDFLEGIRNFPAPTDIKSVRSFFGLVNQASYAFSMRPVMQPFRDLLKKGVKFQWTSGLQKAFEEAKDHIMELVKEGVRIFDLDKPTCLATDWCRQGVGFFLMQKHCSCQGPLTPTCCVGGWKLVFAGGKFNTPAESKYAPVEGEALAVVVGLQKTRYFVLGCKNLIVATDHKPLLKIFGDRQLEDMENPRLTRLKEKSLYFRFEMVHVPGRFHKGPDAMSRVLSTETSRDKEEGSVDALLAGVSTKELRGDILSKMFDSHPVETGCEEFEEVQKQSLLAELSQIGDCWDMEEADVCSVRSPYLTALTWSRLAHETSKDEILSEVKDIIENGDQEDMLKAMEKFPRFKLVLDRLSTLEGVLMYKNRAVIPSRLQDEVLVALHSAHQGVAGMFRRAETCVYWPGMTRDIKNVRERCVSCNTVAPSNPAQPPAPLPSPSYPFEMIAADYCMFAGHTYLVIVDRFSGWLSVYYCGEDASSKDLIDKLRVHFTTFGISSELSSDQGSQFCSHEVKRFLESWGCSQRLSSVYFPHSNCRAEVGIKSAKRMLRENVDANGKLVTDRFLRALLQYRNTPDQDTKLSPAEVIFGRAIKDFLPIPPGKYYQPQEGWRLDRDSREMALKMRYCRGLEKWSEHTKQLKPLSAGDKVLVQNQCGTPKIAKRWDRSGTILEVGDFDKFKVKIDGSGRVTERNRRFLRKMFPTQVTQPAPGNTFKSNMDTSPTVTASQNEKIDDVTPTLEPVEPEIQVDVRQAPESARDTIVEVPLERAGAGSPTPRRWGRERKPNIKFSASEWDLSE